MRLTIENSGRLLDLVADHAVDLALATMRAPEPGFVCQRFVTQRVLLLVPAGHPLAERDRVRPGELKGVTLVAREVGSMTRQLFEEGLAEAGVTIEPALVFGGREAVKEAVAAGLGVGYVLDRGDRSRRPPRRRAARRHGLRRRRVSGFLAAIGTDGRRRRLHRARHAAGGRRREPTRRLTGRAPRRRSWTRHRFRWARNRAEDHAAPRRRKSPIATAARWPPTSAGLSADAEHDLADMGIGFHHAAGLGGGSQRHFGVDHRPDGAGFEQRPDVSAQGRGERALLGRAARAQRAAGDTSCLDMISARSIVTSLPRRK